MDEEWVDLRCTWVDEARWARSVLEASGIEAVIPDEHTLVLPLAPGTEPDAVRLLVRASDLEKAFEVLDRHPAWPPVE